MFAAQLMSQALTQTSDKHTGASQQLWRHRLVPGQPGP